MKIKFIVILVGLLVLACSKPNIEITDAYTPVRTEKQRMYAAYLDIKNNSDSAIELSNIKSTSFKNIMLHQSSVENGIAKMRHLDKLIIQENASVKLEPNGKHIMLMQATENIWEKGSFILTLEFSDGTSIEQIIPLQKPNKK